jgi:hypothetical protein
MVYKSKSICDVDHGYVVKDRSGMVVIGLSNDEMQASFKMSPACFEQFYEDLAAFRERFLKDIPRTDEI